MVQANPAAPEINELIGRLRKRYTLDASERDRIEKFEEYARNASKTPNFLDASEVPHMPTIPQGE